MAKKMFKNTTLKQKFSIYFKENGFREVDSRTGKYKVFYGNGLFYFIGKSGAVRVNHKNAATGSRSHTESFRKMITEWAVTKDQKEKVEV